MSDTDMKSQADGQDKAQPANEDVIEQAAAEPTVTDETDAAPAQTTEAGEDGSTGGATGTEADESLSQTVERLQNALARAKADYQNLERNAAREKTEAIRFANAGLARTVLQVVDDFERSLASADQGDDAQAVLDGVKLVYDNLRKALGDHGIKEIEAEGKAFDPQVHEAMMQQPSSEHDDGTVMQVLAKGYVLHDRVIRPSKVIVAKGEDS
ncbi:MAG: nucleotide exchange factor GrpE [Phycisphaerae bacterium]